MAQLVFHIKWFHPERLNAEQLWLLPVLKRPVLLKPATGSTGPKFKAKGC